MFFGIAFGVSAGKRSGPPVATIVLSNSSIAENAALGAAVGTLSVINATGTPAFTLVDSAGSRFALSGANVQRGATALDYETATSHNIIVSVTGMTPSPSNATFNIQVTNIAEVPVISTPPTLSPTSGAVGTLITCGTGSWTNTPTSYAYQWMRTGVDISGATSSTYTSVLADDTFTLTCKVLASNADGPAAGYSTTSNSHTVGAATYLIDTMTQAAARAYSTRKLRSAHAGSALRVRRSSDNAEQDIGFSGENLDTSALTTFVGAGNGYIVRWYDQSSAVDNAVNVTAAQQCRIVISGTLQTRNGKACLQTEQLGGVVTTAALSIKEAVAVASYTAAVYVNYDGLVYGDAGTGICMAGAIGTANFYDGPTTVYINNVLTGSRTTPMSGTLFQARSILTTPGTSAVLTVYTNSAATMHWQGSVCEILVFTSALSAGDITTSYNSQKAYWGTP